MSLELINLLPPDKKRSFRRSYFMRLGTVAVILIASLVVVHGVLLLPSTLYLSVSLQTAKQELAEVNAQQGANGETETNRRLAALKQSAAHLARLETAPAASAAVRAVLAVPRQGIRITSITYAPSTASAANGSMTITGIALTRESLRSYNLALSAAPFISKADLPISSYASEANIPFTVTVTGTLQP